MRISAKSTCRRPTHYPRIFPLPKPTFWNLIILNYGISKSNEDVEISGKNRRLVSQWLVSKTNYQSWFFWYLETSNTKFQADTLPYVHYAYKFSCRKNFFVLENLYVIYIYVKRRYWSLKKNRRVDPHSYIGEILRIQICDQNARKPPGVNFIEFYLCWFFLFYYFLTKLSWQPWRKINYY